MENNEVLELLLVSIDIVSIVNELNKKENMVNADYSDVLTDLKWNRHILRNRLEHLDEIREYNWKVSKEYMEKLE